MKNLLLAITGSFIGAFSFGQQKNITHQAGYWFRYYNQTELSNNFSLHLELDERRFVNPDRQAQLFSHLHLHKKLDSHWDVALGVNYNFTNSNNNRHLAVPEFRPWQEVTWLSVGKTNVQIRYRTEQRFVHHNDSEVLTPGYGFRWRHRLRWQLTIPLRQAPAPTLSIRFSEEVMMNTSTKAFTFDQNRLFVAAEKQLSSTVYLDIGYLNLLQPGTSEGYYDRHIIRTTVYHRLGRLKK